MPWRATWPLPQVPLPLTDRSYPSAFFRCETVVKTDLSLTRGVSGGTGYSLTPLTVCTSGSASPPKVAKSQNSFPGRVQATHSGPGTRDQWPSSCQHAPGLLSSAKSISGSRSAPAQGGSPQARNPAPAHHLSSSSPQAWKYSLTAWMNNCACACPYSPTPNVTGLEWRAFRVPFPRPHKALTHISAAPFRVHIPTADCRPHRGHQSQYAIPQTLLGMLSTM